MIAGDQARREEIVVVSGLPRSGTSMMMKMLKAGGIPLASDGVRQADEDNPRGYFELEAVKRLPGGTDWLADCPGKAVKVISHLVMHLPAGYQYRVLFMNRDLREIMASQARMLTRSGKRYDQGQDQTIMESYRRHLVKVAAWLEGRDNVEWKTFRYQEVVDDPDRAAGELAAFLSGNFSALAAAAQVDPSLYRQKRADGAKVGS